MTFLSVLCAIAVPTLVGFLFVRVCLAGCDDRSLPEEVLLGFGLGLGFTSFTLFLLGALRVPFSLGAVLAVAAASVAGLGTLLLRKRSQGHGTRTAAAPLPTPDESTSSRLLAGALWTWLGLKGALTAWAALVLPIHAWDSWTHWSGGAKFFFFRQGLALDAADPHFFGWDAGRVILNYPLHVSLAEVWFALCLGRFDEVLVKSWAVLYYLGVVGLLYFGLRREASSPVTLLFCLVLASAPLLTYHAIDAYADLPLAWCVLAATVCFWRVLRTSATAGPGRGGLLVLAGCFVALGAWTKQEGVLYLLCFTAALGAHLLARRRSAAEMGRFLLPVGIVGLSWGTFLFGHGIPLFGRGETPSPTGWHWEVLPVIGRELFFSANFNLVFVVLLGVTAMGWRSIVKGDLKYLYGALGGAAALFLGIYLATDNFRWVITLTALDRNVLTALPAVTFVTGLAAVKVWSDARAGTGRAEPLPLVGRPEEPRNGDPARTLWVVLPVFNEAPRLPDLFRRWVATRDLLPHPTRFVLVDDGSSDGSAELLAGFAAAQPGVEVLTHAVNAGLGPTMRDALRHALAHGAKDDLVVTMDADGTQPPERVPGMLTRLEEGPFDVVIASRFRPGASVEGLSTGRRFLSWGAAHLFSLLDPIPGVLDYTCGFRLVRLAALGRALEGSGDRIFSGPGFECTAGLLLALADSGASCAEVPFRLEYSRKEGSSHLDVGRTTRGTVNMLLARRLAAAGAHGIPNPAAWAAAAGGVATIAAYFPGVMSPDSLEQYGYASSWVFSTSQPPVQGFLWGVLNLFVRGPFLMLVLQAFAWWLGWYLAATWVFPRSRVRQLGTVLVCGFWPPLFAMVGTIWRDVHLTLALLLAAVLLLRRREDSDDRDLWIAGILVSYASAVRLNALLAVLPFAGWISFEVWRRGRGQGRPGRRLAAVVLCAAAIVFGGRVLNRLLATTVWHQTQTEFVFDLVGISVRTGQNLVPPVIRHGYERPDQLAGLYTAFTIFPIYFGSGPDGVIRETRILTSTDPAVVAEIREAWWSAVKANPGAYLGHRVAVFAANLAWTDLPIHYPFERGIPPNPYGLSSSPSAFSSLVYSSFGASLRHLSILWRPWVYLWLSGLLLAAGVLRTRRGTPTPATILLLASSLLYVLPYFVVAPAADLRYHHWPFAALALASLVYLAETRHRAERAERVGGRKRRLRLGLAVAALVAVTAGLDWLAPRSGIDFGPATPRRASPDGSTRSRGPV